MKTALRKKKREVGRDRVWLCRGDGCVCWGRGVYSSEGKGYRVCVCVWRGWISMCAYRKLTNRNALLTDSWNSVYIDYCSD